MIVENYKTKTWREARKEFLDYWFIHHPMKLGKKSWSRIEYIGFEVCIMYENYGNVTSTSNESYLYFNPAYNTRTNFDTEWDCEFDHENHEWNVKAICLVCLNLIHQEYHFSVWYAQGMKSPYIRIYDLLPEGLTERQRVSARKQFSKEVVPSHLWKYLDKSFFHRTKICLEFSKHWRYRTHLKLLFEYLPNKTKQEELCNYL